VPKSFKLTVKAPPKLYKYPELLKKKEKEEAKKVVTAVLSTTSKVEARMKKRKGEDAADKDVEMASQKAEANEESKDVDMKEAEPKDDKDAKEFTLANPCRMLR
jgi:26S proteasome regulatory subunit N2